MGDALKKVRPGQPLRIPAAAYNTFVDAAQLMKRQEQDRSSCSADAAGPATILVKNTTGADRQRFEPVGLGTPVFGPADNLEAFKNRIVLSAVTPAGSHEGRFAILQAPLKSGAIGAALVHGTTIAQVSVGSESHEWARIVPGQFSLSSGSSGGAQILWKETGTGAKWALLRLGSTASLLRPVQLTQTGGANGNGTSTVSYTYTVTDAAAGNLLATGVTPEHRRMKCKVLSATRGVAWMEGQTCHLVLTDELPDFGACS